MTQAKPLCCDTRHFDVAAFRAALVARKRRSERLTEKNFIAPIFAVLLSEIIDALDASNPPASDTPTDANSTATAHPIAPGVTGEG